MKRQQPDGDQEGAIKMDVMKYGRRSVFSELDRTNEYRIYCLDEGHIKLSAQFSRLRRIVDYLQCCSNLDTCIEHLQRSNCDTNILVLAQNSISALRIDFNVVADMPHIQSIYLFDDEKQKESPQKILRDHEKVKEVFTDLKTLWLTVSRHVQQLTSSETLVREPIVSSKKERTLGRLTRRIRHPADWFTNLLEILMETVPTRNGKELFVDECRLLYRDDLFMFNALQEFDTSYVSTEAIRWYTRNGFIYRLLNEALRQKNQSGILLLHFFIYDLYRQLISEQTKNDEPSWLHKRVYRGQLMSNEEIKHLHETYALQPMFAASFLSTTTDIDVALAFSGAGAYDVNSSIQSVLFDINCSLLEPEIGVADIGYLSYNMDECEILFAPLHILNVHKVDFDEQKRVWNVRCSISGESDGMRIDLDQRLMELELALRFLKVQAEEASTDVKNHSGEEGEETRMVFYAGVACLLRELNLPKKSCVTLDLNPGTSSIQLFELQEIRTLDELKFLRHKSQIEAKMLAILYDCLGTISKCNGHFHLALDYYLKAAALGEGDLRTISTRKVSIKGKTREEVRVYIRMRD